jgi:archaellum biogenesis ATPase FlaH
MRQKYFKTPKTERHSITQMSSELITVTQHYIESKISFRILNEIGSYQPKHHRRVLLDRCSVSSA